MIREAEFTRRMRSALETRGAFVAKIHGHAMQRAGLPDFYVSHPRWRGWLELKVGDGKLSTLQLATMMALVKSGDRALCLTTRGLAVSASARVTGAKGLHKKLIADTEFLSVAERDVEPINSFFRDPLRFISKWWGAIEANSPVSEITQDPLYYKESSSTGI